MRYPHFEETSPGAAPTHRPKQPNRLALAVANALGVSLLLAVALPAEAGVNVWTMRYDNARSSVNAKESILTPAVVSDAAQFKLARRFRADDQVYTTPLYLADLAMKNDTVASRNMVFFGSANNTVYGYDSDTGELVWQRNLNGANERAFSKFDVSNSYEDASGKMGIIGTPVIDPVTRRLYVVTKTVAGSGSTATYAQTLHALDLINSGAVINKVVIGGSVAAPTAANPAQTMSFVARWHNQRPGLALVNGVVYVMQASYGDANAYQGWVMGYRASDLSQTSVWATVDSVSGKGGIWMAGTAPAADADGNLIFAVGNGNISLDTPNYGHSIVKLAPVAGAKSMKVMSRWVLPPEKWFGINHDDKDQGSSGAILVANASGKLRVIQGGKDGILHLLDEQNFNAPRNAANRPNYDLDHFTASSLRPGADATLRPTTHIHGAPVYWKSPSGLGYLYLQAENDYLKAYQYDDATDRFGRTAVKSAEFAPETGVGMPGANLTVSTNGTQPGTAIVWAYAVENGDAGHNTVPGRLRAYDATNVAKTLWVNAPAGSFGDNDCGAFAKGTYPVVADGKVFISHFGSASNNEPGGVCSYAANGVKPPPPPPPPPPPVSNGDPTLPTVVIVSPANGTVISVNNVVVSATATAPSGIAKVEFFIDNGRKAVVTSGPYTFTWNSKGFAVGNHTIKVRAFNGLGKVTEQSIVVIKN